MATFLVLIDFTEQGIKAIKDSPARANAAVAQAEKVGIKVKHIYWTSGIHDGMLILEADDEAAVSAFVLSLVKTGNVRTQTLRAYDRAAFESILADVP